MTATIIILAQARFQVQIAQVMTETRDAYSRPAFGNAEWAKCAAHFLTLGYSVEVTGALMESRLMRWTRENATQYDAPTCADLCCFLDTPAGFNALQYEMAA